VELFDAAPGRPNVLATTDQPPRIVLSTHLDTVPPHVPARVVDGVVYGRGACDAKGIMAAQIVAAERLRAEGVEGIGLLFVVDEEMGSVGARAANAHPLAEECRWLIDGEPTDNRLATGSKGSLRLTLCTAGVPAHSAYPSKAARRSMRYSTCWETCVAPPGRPTRSSARPRSTSASSPGEHGPMSSPPTPTRTCKSAS